MAGETVRDVTINIGLKLRDQKLPGIDVSEVSNQIEALSGSANSVAEALSQSVRSIAQDISGVGASLSGTLGQVESASTSASAAVDKLATAQQKQSETGSSSEASLQGVTAASESAATAVDKVALSTDKLSGSQDTMATAAASAGETVTTSLKKAEGSTTGLEQATDDLVASQRKLDSSFDNLSDQIDRFDIELQSADDTIDDASASADALKRSTDSLGESQRHASQSAVNQGEATIQLGQRMKGAGEGAFTLARGFALVGAGSEDDLQKALQTIAQFQGAFDIFKGGVEILDNVAQAVKIYGQTSASSAVKNTALAASNTAVATTSRTAAAGMTALQIASGPVGIALAAIAALAFPVIQFLRRMGREADTAKDELNDLNKALDFGSASIEDNIKSAIDFRKRLEIPQMTREFKGFNEQLVDSDSQLRFIDTQMANMKAQLERINTIASRGITSEEQRERLQERATARLNIIQQLESQRSQVISSRLKIEQDITREKENQTQKDLQQLRTLQEKVKQEQERNKSIRAGIGALTDVEFNRLGQLNREAGQRKLTREELDEVARLGGRSGQQFAETEFARRGAARLQQKGGFGNLGINASNSGAAQQAAQLANNLGVDLGGDLDAQMRERMEAVNAKQKEAREAFLEVLEENEQELERFNIELKRFQQRAARRQRQSARGGQ